MNSFRRYALEAFAAAVVAAAGCGEKDGSAEYARGVKLFDRKDFEAAAAEFSTRVALAPGDVDAKLMLSRTMTALGDLPKAVKAAEDALALEPKAVDAKMLAAETAFYARDYKKARKHFGEVANDVSLPVEVRSAGECGLAVVDIGAMAGGNMEFNRESARIHLFTAVRLDPRNAPARYHLGLLYRDSFGYSEAALDQFELYARLDKKDTNRVARVRAKTIPELKDAIAKNPVRKAASRDSALSAKELRRAEEAFSKKQFKTARLRYAEAFKADPLNHLAAAGLADAWYASEPTKAGAAEAFRHCKAACSLRPGSKELLLKAGDYANKCGNAAGAVEAYSRALAASPNDAGAIRALAEAYANNGKPRIGELFRRYGGLKGAGL